jgi:hypothetical protein
VSQRNARYDYEYSDEELLQRVKGQLVLHTKTSLLAIAFNNHCQAKAAMCPRPAKFGNAGQLESPTADPSKRH